MSGWPEGVTLAQAGSQSANTRAVKPVRRMASSYHLRTTAFHNIKPNVDYPVVLVTIADTDDRVVTGHSFK